MPSHGFSRGVAWLVAGSSQADAFAGSSSHSRWKCRTSGPGELELLLVGATAEDADQWLRDVAASLARRGHPVLTGFASYPRDGRAAVALIESACPGCIERTTDSQLIVIVDPAIIRLHRLLRRIASGDLCALLLVESGVGKEVFADAIHAKSPRAKGPFIRINCGGLSEPLLESELFGHEKGAFTGADRARRLRSSSSPSRRRRRPNGNRGSARARNTAQPAHDVRICSPSAARDERWRSGQLGQSRARSDLSRQLRWPRRHDARHLNDKRASVAFALLRAGAMKTFCVALMTVVACVETPELAGEQTCDGEDQVCGGKADDTNTPGSVIWSRRFAATQMWGYDPVVGRQGCAKGSDIARTPSGLLVAGMASTHTEGSGFIYGPGYARIDAATGALGASGRVSPTDPTSNRWISPGTIYSFATAGDDLLVGLGNLDTDVAVNGAMVARFDPAGARTWKREGHLRAGGSATGEVATAADSTLELHHTDGTVAWTYTKATDHVTERYSLLFADIVFGGANTVFALSTWGPPRLLKLVNGQLAWLKDFVGLNNSLPRRALARAVDGSLFVLGIGSSGPTIIKLDANGDEQWRATPSSFPELSKVTSIKAIAATPDGGVALAAVTSTTSAGLLKSPLVAVLDDSGELEWVQVIESISHLENLSDRGVQAIAVDGDSVFVTGEDECALFVTRLRI